MTMPIDLDSRVRVPESVVSRELEGETVLLNLDTGVYFGLDEVGTDMWRAMLAADTLRDAVDAVQALYDADGTMLRGDLLKLANELSEKGLVQVTSAASFRT